MSRTVVADPTRPAAAGAGDVGQAVAVARALRLPVAAALAAASGLAIYAAFPTPGWWPLAPVGVGGLALAVRGQRARSGALLGWIAGLAMFLPQLSWSGVYVGLLPWVALAVLESLFMALLGLVHPFAWRARGGRAATVVAVAGLWVAQEGLRGRVPFGGFPWGRLAFSQADAPTLGYAALGGAPLVSAAVAAAGGCLAVAVASLRLRGVRPLGAAQWRAPLPALLVGLAVMGGAAVVPLPVSGQGSTQVAAVQGDVPQPGLAFNARRRAVLDNHAAATLALAARVSAGRAPAPDVVLWPENASDIDPLRNPDAYAVIQNAADRVGVPILVGAVLQQPPGHESNAGILWGPSTGPNPGPGAWYVKQHPAPFAEYVPFRSFFRHFSDKVDLAGNFVAGDRVGVLPVGGVRLGDVICFEVAYDGLVRKAVRAGANLLVVQTNNATFGYTDESVQQLAMSRLRAVESGRAVVHISTVGVSALIMPDGRVLQRTSLFTQRVLQARLPLRSGQTVATRVGWLPEALLALLGLLLAGTGIRSAGRLPGRGAGNGPGGPLVHHVPGALERAPDTERPAAQAPAGSADRSPPDVQAAQAGQAGQAGTNGPAGPDERAGGST